MLLRWGGRFAVAACTWVLSACAGDGPPPDLLPPSPSPAPSPSAVSVSFDAIQQTIFTVHCLFAGCHNATDRSGNMVLAEGQAYSNLVNVVPFNTAAAAAGFRRVVPGNTAQSFLLIKLVGGPNFDPQFGSPMPLTGGPLSSADIDRIRQWILAGAPAPASSAATASEFVPAAPPPTPSPPPLGSGLPPTATPTATPTPSSTPLDAELLSTETPTAPM